MTEKWWKTGLAVLAALVVAGVPAYADTALSAVVGSTGVNSYPGYSCGWQFMPTENITVTKLGVWMGADSCCLNFDHVITIYDSAGNVKISGTIVAGNVSSTIVGGYAYVDVAGQNVQLSAGQTYVIASYWVQTNTEYSDRDVQYTSEFSAGSSSIILGEVDLRLAGLGMPVDLGPTWNTLLSANFQFDIAPSDPAAMIGALVDSVIELNLQEGIENSLDAKLAAALDALDDVNTNNDASAVNRLEAFISEVNAQRGKKITDPQATALVEDAQAIITLLTGP
jgi:hypothetical protein